MVAQKARQGSEDFVIDFTSVNRKPVTQKVDKGAPPFLGLPNPLLERLFSQQLTNILAQARMFPPLGMQFCHAIHSFFTVQLRRG